MKRMIAAAAVVAALSTASAVAAGAAPSRTHCEQVARQAANGSGYRQGSAGWRKVYNETWLACMAGKSTILFRGSTRYSPPVWIFS